MTDTDKILFAVESLSLRVSSLEEALRLGRNPRQQTKACNETFQIVVRVVCEVFGCSEHSITLSRRKWQEIALPRQAAMVLTMQFSGAALKTVGRLFKRDHGTVLHAERAIKNRRLTDKDFRRKYSTAEQLIKLHLQAHHERSIQPPTVPGSTPEPIPQGAGHTKIPSSLGEVDRSP